MVIVTENGIGNPMMLFAFHLARMSFKKGMNSSIPPPSYGLTGFFNFG